MTLSASVLTPSGFGNLILYGLGEPSGFVEANLATPISFVPQTIGWLVVLIMLLVYGAYRIFKTVKYWRDNRYRFLCISQFPDFDSEDFEYEMYHIMSTARAIANRANPNSQAHLFGVAWLIDMDLQCTQEALLHCELGKQWMKVLTFERRDPICFNERKQLLACCEHWMLKHCNSRQRPAKISLIASFKALLKKLLKTMRGGQHGV